MTAKRLVTIFVAIGLFPPGANSQVNLNQCLIAYYPFNGNADDATGNGNNGIPMNGVKLTTDRFGNPNSAYLFDGVDDYIAGMETSEVTRRRPEPIPMSLRPVRFAGRSLVRGPSSWCDNRCQSSLVPSQGQRIRL